MMAIGKAVTSLQPRTQTHGHPLTQLLDQLLVLVQLLEVINVLGVDAGGRCLLAVLHITQHAHLHAWAGDVGQLDGARETLVLLGIVVLEADLQLNGLHELAWLGTGGLHQVCSTHMHSPQL